MIVSKMKASASPKTASAAPRLTTAAGSEADISSAQEENTHPLPQTQGKKGLTGRKQPGIFAKKFQGAQIFQKKK